MAEFEKQEVLNEVFRRIDELDKKHPEVDRHTISLVLLEVLAMTREV